MEYTNTLIMEDVNTIIKQLLEINIIENKLINKDNLQIFKNKYQYLSNDMKKYIIEHALSKITECYLINIILINKKVTLNQDDYKMFHDIIYKYLHTKCDDIYKLYDIITKYECEDKLEEL